MPERVLPGKVRLHWREAGVAAGPPVVWVHGGSIEDSSFMLPDLEPFLDRVRALFPDVRGHGLSQKFGRVEEQRYGRKAADLVAWLDALGIDRAVVGGASMGGALSLWMAAGHPDRVRAVVSISGPPYAPLPEDCRWWAEHRPLVAAGCFEGYFDANVRLRMGEDALRRLKERPERYAQLTAPLRQHTVESLLAVLDETYSRTEWLADCARIRCPVLVVAGTEDTFPTVEMSRRVAETVPGARLHVVQGGSHFPNRSHRAEVQAVVGEFLAGIGVLG